MNRIIITLEEVKEIIRARDEAVDRQLPQAAVLDDADVIVIVTPYPKPNRDYADEEINNDR